MRITGGQAKGIPLSAPRGKAVRPATDQTREAVFSSLGLPPEGLKVLDLFAGTGAYGLEAWSRGAVSVTFVENHGATLNILRQNAEAVARAVQAKLADFRFQRADATRPDPGDRFGWIFADPPYPLFPAILSRLFETVEQRARMEPDARFILEHPGHVDAVPAGWRCLKRRAKGPHDPALSIFGRDIAG